MTMADTLLTSIPGITPSQQSALKKGGLVTVSDVLLFPGFDVSQRCRLAPQAVQEIVGSIARASGRQPNLLRDVVRNGSEVITTGDASLDEILGGGIRVGMIWEFVGESAVGKTQLALQLSLLVQLPVAQGGLNGSAAYLTTSGSLPTPRLVQLLHSHPQLAGSRSTLDNVQTSTTRTVSSLLHVLTDVLPASILAAKARSPSRSPPPLKLLIIDSIAELLHHDEDGGKTSTATLSERSRNLSAIAAQLHALAATHQLAVVALNRVTDTWDHRRPADVRPTELLYADQARIFGGVEGGSKSAALGLVWANQVNARIMLSRTARRRHHAAMAVAASVAPHEEDGHDRKRLRAEGGGAVRMDDVSVRRLTVVFSSVCPPASVDFVVTSRGVETLADDDDDLGIVTVTAPVSSPPSMTTVKAAPAVAGALTGGVARPPLAEVSPLDVGSVASDFQPPRPGDFPVGEAEDDEDAYWREVDDFLFAGDSIDVGQASDPS